MRTKDFTTSIESTKLELKIEVQGIEFLSISYISLLCVMSFHIFLYNLNMIILG